MGLLRVYVDGEACLRLLAAFDRASAFSADGLDEAERRSRQARDELGRLRERKTRGARAGNEAAPKGRDGAAPLIPARARQRSAPPRRFAYYQGDF